MAHHPVLAVQELANLRAAMERQYLLNLLPLIRYRQSNYYAIPNQRYFHYHLSLLNVRSNHRGQNY